MGRRVIVSLVLVVFLLAMPLAFAQTDQTSDDDWDSGWGASDQGGGGGPDGSSDSSNGDGGSQPPQSGVHKAQQRALAQYGVQPTGVGDSGSPSPSGEGQWWVNQQDQDDIVYGQNLGNEYTSMNEDVAEWVNAHDASWDAGTTSYVAWSSQTWAEGAFQFADNRRTITETSMDQNGVLTVSTTTAELEDGEIVADSATTSQHQISADGDLIAYTIQAKVGDKTKTAKYEVIDQAIGSRMRITIDGATYTVNPAGKLLGDDGNLVENEKTIEAFEKACDSMPGCTDELVNHRVRNDQGQWGGDIWRTFGTLLQGYQQYRGLLRLTSLFGDEFSRERVEQRKQELSESLCVIGGLGRCLESAVCNAWMDYDPGESAVITKDLHDAPAIGAMVKGYKVGPITVRGVPTTQLKSWFGNATFIDGQWYDLSDPAFDSSTLPDVNLYFYYVQFAMNNPSVPESTGGAEGPIQEGTRSFNLHFIGEREAKWWSQAQDLAIGQQARDTVKKYSTTNYDRVCLRFNPPFDIASGDGSFTFGGWSGVGWGSHGGAASEACDTLVSYAGAPTSVTDDPPPPPPPSGSLGPGVSI